MKTDDLITMLATGSAPVDPQIPLRRFTAAMGWGLFFSLLLMMATLGVRADLSTALSLPMFWVKLIFAVAVAVASLIGAFRLSRPGVSFGAVPLALGIPVIAVWTLAAVVIMSAPAAERLTLVLGHTWLACPFLIAMLSIPIFIAAFWAMKNLAPTRPKLAGGISGLLAGSAGAAVYCLHCPEMAAPFLGVWYLIGMLIPAAIGAALGAKLLRW